MLERWTKLASVQNQGKGDHHKEHWLEIHFLAMVPGHLQHYTYMSCSAMNSMPRSSWSTVFMLMLMEEEV